MDLEKLSEINSTPSLRSLCLKLDREVWAKVESKECTQSWGREQTGLMIIDFVKQLPLAIENAELQKDVNNWKQLHELVSGENERKGIRLYDSHEALRIVSSKMKEVFNDTAMDTGIRNYCRAVGEVADDALVPKNTSVKKCIGSCNCEADCVVDLQPNSEKCNRCEIDDKYEEVKQLPKHSCGKDGVNPNWLNG